MPKKKSFIIHLDSLQVLDELGETQEERLIEAGKLLFAFRDFHNEEELELEPVTRIAFSPFRNQFIRDLEKYKKTCERNQINGSKGGRKPLKPKKPVKDIEVQEEEVVKPETPKPKKPKPKKVEVPSYDEFLEYALTKTKDVNKWKLRLKYDSWIENDWKDGHSKPIKAWKTKLLNTLPYLTNEQGNSSKKNAGTGNSRTAGTYSRSKAVDSAQAKSSKGS